MPTSTDLLGLGMPAQLANALGNDVALVTAAGTTQATAIPLKVTNNEVTAATSQTGVALPVISLVATPYYVFVSSATSAVVYAPLGNYLNGTLNGSLTVAQNKSCIFFEYKNNYWWSNLSA